MGQRETNLPPVKNQILSVIEPGVGYNCIQLRTLIREKYGIYGATNITSYLTYMFRSGTLTRSGFRFWTYKLKEKE